MIKKYLIDLSSNQFEHRFDFNSDQNGYNLNLLCEVAD